MASLVRALGFVATKAGGFGWGAVENSGRGSRGGGGGGGIGAGGDGGGVVGVCIGDNIAHVIVHGVADVVDGGGGSRRRGSSRQGVFKIT